MHSKHMLEKYEKAKSHRSYFESLFEECYEYALPMRKSFFDQGIGQRRDDKIFDETAVVGTQEFASRLQSGLVPNFARWADFIAGSEVPKEQQDEVNNQLDEVTEYVFLYLSSISPKYVPFIFSLATRCDDIKKINNVMYFIIGYL